MKVEAFWDASILVPLCVEQQPYTRMAHELSKRCSVTAWWGTPVEVTGAFTRLKRASVISHSEFEEAKSKLERHFLNWDVIAPADTIRRSACGLLERYALRAGDALQLAAAFAWCEGIPAGELFLTADRRLAEVAGMAGFSLEPSLTAFP